MPNAQIAPTLRGRLLLALGMCAFGSVIALATFDIGPLDSSEVNGPPWLAAAAGGAIIAGGLAFLAGQNRPILSGFLAILVLIGLASIANWIAFGFGSRTCGASIMIWVGEVQGLGCRIPFGIGALITNAIVVMSVIVTIQTALGGPPRLARLRRGGEWLVLISLLPVLVPIFLGMVAVLGAGAIKTRVTTGKWPRNEKFIAHKEKARQERLRAQGQDP
jgi:hypothetical protein